MKLELCSNMPRAQWRRGWSVTDFFMGAVFISIFHLAWGPLQKKKISHGLNELLARAHGVQKSYVSSRVGLSSLATRASLRCLLAGVCSQSPRAVKLVWHHGTLGLGDHPQHLFDHKHALQHPGARRRAVLPDFAHGREKGADLSHRSATPEPPCTLSR